MTTVYDSPRSPDSTPQVAQRAGVTERQLRYWIRVGYVKTEGSRHPGTGQRVRISQREEEVLAEAVRLMEEGYHIDRAFEIARTNVIGKELHTSEAFAERFPSADELITERFGKGLPPPAVVCRSCGGALCKDTKDRWVHAYGGLCIKAVPSE